MANRAEGANHADLIDKLKLNNVIRRDDVAMAMLKADRGDFAPSNPYQDRPQNIGFGTSISAPHMQLSYAPYKVYPNTQQH